MIALVGGLIALLLGIIGIFGWWSEFIYLLKGIIPPILILSGALAAYLGTEELKDKRRAETEAAKEPFTPSENEADKYKAEVEELKAKLASMETTEGEGEAEEQKDEDKA